MSKLKDNLKEAIENQIFAKHEQNMLGCDYELIGIEEASEATESICKEAMIECIEWSYNNIYKSVHNSLYYSDKLNLKFSTHQELLDYFLENVYKPIK